MSEVENEEAVADFSLADLTDLDVTDVAEIRFSSLPGGVYQFAVESASLDETTNRDNEKRFVAEVKFKVIEVKAVVKKGVDLESLVGKVHTEKYYIVPEKAQEGIGLIRGVITDMGGNSEGKLGEILEGIVGHEFSAKIVEQKDKDDPSRVYARLKLDPAKKK